MPAPAPLTVTGRTLTLRYAEPADAPRLLELGSDAGRHALLLVGAYERIEEPQAYIAGLAGKRERGELLEFLIDHHEHGPIGVTGPRRSCPGATATRRSARGSAATTGAPAPTRESKALVAALGFGTLGLERLTAWTNTRNGRSQRALERVGFRREGVLRNWHRHGDEMHDVVVFGMLRAAWEASPLREIPAVVEGTPPAPFVLV